MALEKIHIVSTKLILTEGMDAQMFLVHMLQNTGINAPSSLSVQVFDYGGITELTRYIRNLQKMDGFDRVETIVIARDAETSVTSAIQSVNASLKASAIIDADIVPFKIERKRKKAGILMFPGLDENGRLIASGTLEDLCIRIFKEQNTINSVEPYLSDFQSKERSFTRPHKNKLHASLSFTDAYVGLKLGETAKIHGFDFASSCFAPFLDIIKQM
jgi:hypothetical protein